MKLSIILYERDDGEKQAGLAGLRSFWGDCNDYDLSA
jgi:hypothetical protein